MGSAAAAASLGLEIEISWTLKVPTITRHLLSAYATTVSVWPPMKDKGNSFERAVRHSKRTRSSEEEGEKKERKDLRQCRFVNEITWWTDG